MAMYGTCTSHTVPSLLSLCSAFAEKFAQHLSSNEADHLESGHSGDPKGSFDEFGGASFTGLRVQPHQRQGQGSGSLFHSQVLSLFQTV